MLLPYSSPGMIRGSPVGGTVANYGLMPMLDPDVAAQVDAQKFGAQKAYDAQTYAASLGQGRFNQIFPWLQSQMGNLGNQFATAGGQSGKSPEITVGGVLSPQQVQQQVNQSRATTDQSAQTQMNQNQQKTASQGFGSRSPLLSALNGQTQANALSTNASNETNLRLNAAQQNAQQLLATQNARENQFASRQREDIQRRQPYWQLQSSLLGAIAGLA